MSGDSDCTNSVSLILSQSLPSAKNRRWQYGSVKIVEFRGCAICHRCLGGCKSQSKGIGPVGATFHPYH